MSIYRRKSELKKRLAHRKSKKKPKPGTYWCHFWVDGKFYQRSTGKTNRNAARKEEQKIRNRIENGETGATPPSFRDAMADAAQWAAVHRSPNTHTCYVSTSVPLVKFFSDTRTDRISRRDVERYVEWRKQTVVGTKAPRTIANVTINNELNIASATFNRLIDEGVLSRNPFLNQTLKDSPRNYHVLSHVEEETYLGYCGQPLRDFAMLMLQLGARPTELLSLKVSQVHLADNYIQIEAGKTRSARRRLILTGRAKEILVRRVSKTKGLYLFPEYSGKDALHSLDHAHKRALKRAMKEHKGVVSWFRLYDLRHSFATRAAQSGMDAPTLAAALGHADLRMCGRYVHPMEEHRRQAMDRFEKYDIATQLQEFEQLAAKQQNSTRVDTFSDTKTKTHMQ